MFIRMLLRNPRTLRRLMRMDPDEPRYVRPPREYEIPAYRAGKKHCTSNEKYLRPTRYCNPREPDIIAMANELGAYELSDWEFADVSHWFVKTKLVAEMLPFDSLSATLRRGTGTCYHLTSLWIGLCRAAGIKARYKTFKMVLPEAITSRTMLQQGEMVANFFSQPTPEAEAEVCIDGKWVVGHVAMRPEMVALGYLPVTRLGEDAMDFTFKAIPGTEKRFESIPLSTGIGMKIFMRLGAGVMERTSVVAQTRALPIGKKIIDDAGGIEAYDRKARGRFKRFVQIVEPQDNKALIFEPQYEATGIWPSVEPYSRE
jgi:hypothetical protein